ncbi:MAG TPA: hypothetical protein VJA19_09315, partial [Pseudomonas sp.]|nr:hypothetical protein [Pseudomonas sp.]
RRAAGAVWFARAAFSMGIAALNPSYEKRSVMRCEPSLIDRSHVEASNRPRGNAALDSPAEPAWD